MPNPALVLDRRAALLAGAAALLPRRLAARVVPPAPSDGTTIVPELASVFAGQVDPALCFVSEKYDGVRALWNGRRLRHRSGRALVAPASFLARLPSEPLDGELWLGRRRFDELSALVRRAAPRAAEWSAVRYMVFDQPLAPGSFEARLARLSAVVPRQGTAAEVAPQWRVADRAALERALAEIVARGGEGLVLHLASAAHVGGRSAAVCKLKPQLDAEARVVGHRRGIGKYRDVVGALEVESADGTRFFLGSGLRDADRREPPAIGSLVTYRYRDVTPGGVPRFPTYLRRHEAW